jgi:hypothetical protein
MALFGGSVNEYIPVIAKRATATQAVQSVYDQYDSYYLVGYPDLDKKECAYVITSIMSGQEPSSGVQFGLSSNYFCNGNLIERKPLPKPVIPEIPGQPYPNQSLSIIQ